MVPLIVTEVTPFFTCWSRILMRSSTRTLISVWSFISFDFLDTNITDSNVIYNRKWKIIFKCNTIVEKISLPRILILRHYNWFGYVMIFSVMFS